MAAKSASKLLDRMNLLNMSTQKHDTRQTLLYTTKHQKKAALIADRDGDQVSIMILDSKVQGVGDDVSCSLKLAH